MITEKQKKAAKKNIKKAQEKWQSMAGKKDLRLEGDNYFINST